MANKLLPSFVVTVALSSAVVACGGAPTPPDGAPDATPDETPIPTNPPGAVADPGLAVGAGPPPELPSEPDEDDAEGEDPMTD